HVFKLIVENCLKKQLNFVVIKDNPQQSEANKTTRGPTPHDSKNEKKRFAILMRICPTIFVLRMSPHMSISAPITSVNYSRNIRESDLMRG
ncbi:pdu/cob regulatory protein PocR, partial [Salmonella enterica subsp. enterica serovar Heidelberg str. RI-11-014588]